MIQRFSGLSHEERTTLGGRIRNLIPAVAACSLAKGSRKQYGGHFNILAQAAEAGGFDPLA